MKAKFKGPRKIDGQFFGKGEHTLSEKLAGHWFVKALIKSGDIVVVHGAVKAEAPSESAEKAEKSEKPEEKAHAPQPHGKSNKAK